MAITSPGIGSGLDVNGIVSQLMAIERQPLNKLDTKEASYQANISAYGSLKGALSSLQNALSGLTKANTFAGSYKTSSSDSSVATATAADGAIAGNYNVAVTQLAQSQKLRTAGTYSGVGATLGSGTISLQFGTTTPNPLDPDPAHLTLPATFAVNANKAAATITIDPTKNTLLDVRDAINSAKAGVTASIVNDGSGYRLAISSNDSGAANSLKITVTDTDGNNTDGTGLSALAFDPTASHNLIISQGAKDAIFSVDGIPIVKSSNTVSDAIDGVTLSLLKETGSSNIGVSLDRSGISKSIQDFAKAYNETNKALKEMTAYDPETKQAGVLQGDAAARSIQSQLRAAMHGNLNYAAGGISNLAQIGISFARDGAMTIDQTKLNAAINDPTKDVATVFTGVAKLTDNKISALSSIGKPHPGRYDISVTQLATQGFSKSILSSKTVTTGVNDAFSISIDSIHASITLAAGTYTGTTLAAEIQSKLNGVAAIKSAGSSVAVSYQSISSLSGDAAADMVALTGGTFDVTLYGSTKTLTIGDGDSYGNDPAALAADLQTKLNSAFGVSDITVAESAGKLTINSDGAQAPAVLDGSPLAQTVFGATQTSATGTESLTITSNKYGSTSKANTITSLLFSGTVSTSGVDVAGTIGGMTATGSGQDLAADGAAKGIRLRISGGNLGERGTVTFEKGFADRLNEMLDGFTSAKGTLSSKTQGMQDSIKSLDTRREELGRRLTQIEARYRKQFTNLDTLMSNMTATQNSLTQQLAGLARSNT